MLFYVCCCWAEDEVVEHGTWSYLERLSAGVSRGFPAAWWPKGATGKGSGWPGHTGVESGHSFSRREAEGGVGLLPSDWMMGCRVG